MRFVVVLAVLCVIARVSWCDESTQSLTQREHPFLFGNKELYSQAKQRALKYPWAQKQIEGILKDADEILAKPLEVPAKGGQWGHHYVCKKCSVRLETKGTRHVCPNCKKEYTGWPYDEVVAAGVHKKNWTSVRTLGLAYQLNGAEKYAERARQILLAYADAYVKFPIHDYRGSAVPIEKGARAFAQTLDEAIAAIELVWGYDMVYACPKFTADERKHVETELFREIVKTIQRNDMGVSNWQSWHNGAFATIGYCLQDADLVAKAINGPHGFKWQLKHSILPDGFWYEGSPSYHFYSLQALLTVAEAAHFAGENLYTDPALKGLLAAPVDYVFPNGKFPAVNDSDELDITGQAGSYEIGYARYKDSRFGSVAALDNRKNVEALLWGENELPPESPKPKAGNSNFPSVGAIMLRQGEGANALNVHLDYGPHGGAHGHMDKLAVILYGLGEILAPDPARVQYGSPLQAQWYKTSVAHNTIVMDQQNQKSATGKLIWESWKPSLAAAQATCDSCYDDVRLTRTLALTPEYLLDITEVETTQPRTFDLAWHVWGKLSASIDVKPAKPLGKSDGYQHLANVRSAETSGSYRVDFPQKNGTVRLLSSGSAKDVVILAEGVSGNPPTSCSAILMRRYADKTVYVSVIEPAYKSPQLHKVELEAVSENTENLAIMVSYGTREDRFVLRSEAPDEGPSGLEMTSRPQKIQPRAVK